MPAPARLPTGIRVYAIPDIHGRADLLQAMLDAIDQDMRADGQRHQGAVAVFLGDYIDRGPRSRRVLDILTNNLPDALQCVFLLGNHEHFLLSFLEGPSDPAGWLFNGGLETLTSYGIDAPSSGFLSVSCQDELRKALLNALPERHLVFLRNLRPSFRLGGYFFAHAGVRPRVPLESQALDDLLWIRGPFLTSTEDFGAVVVHGHTILPRPLVLANRIALDTGAHDSGILTCGVLEGGGLRFLQTSPSPATVGGGPRPTPYPFS
nr:metallophosphoesterase [Roseospira visakhapatnamensis]